MMDKKNIGAGTNKIGKISNQIDKKDGKTGNEIGKMANKIDKKGGRTGSNMDKMATKTDPKDSKARSKTSTTKEIRLRILSEGRARGEGSIENGIARPFTNSMSANNEKNNVELHISVFRDIRV